MKPATDRLIKDKVRRGADVIRRGIYTRAGNLNMRFALTDEPVALPTGSNSITRKSARAKSGGSSCGTAHGFT